MSAPRRLFTPIKPFPDSSNGMILICLDIDGVIYQETSNEIFADEEERVEEKRRRGELKTPNFENCDIAAVNLFNKEAIANLDTLIDLIEEAGYKAGILIHSDWRLYHSNLKEMFQQYTFSEKIIGSADVIHNNKSEDIKAWLSSNMKHYAVKDYVILDDDLVCPKEKLIQCETREGFTSEKLNETLRLLSKTVKQLKPAFEVNDKNEQMCCTCALM